MIYDFTYLGQSVNLALGDLRSNLSSDLSGSQIIWVDLLWREKDDGGKINGVSQIAKKLLMKNYSEKLTRETEFFVWPVL